MSRHKLQRTQQPTRGRLGVSANPPQTPPDTERYPTFSFFHLVPDRRFSVSACSEAVQCGVLDKMRVLSKLSWNEVQNSHHHGNGCEKLPKRAIRVGLPECIKQAPVVLKFHVTDNVPVVGFRDGIVFHVVWLDPHRELYDHG